MKASVADALVVEDDPRQRRAISELVESEGFAVRTAATLAEAREAIGKAPPDLVLCDLELPDGNAIELLTEVSQARTEFVVVTGHASVDSAVAALRLGAWDYLTKPVDVTRLEAVLHQVERNAFLRREINVLRTELRELGRFGRMIGTSDAMAEVYDRIERVAQRNANVLVTGETGTGKELVAEAVHQLGSRREGPFVPVNCGAISPALAESAFFGHEKGSFTGATQRQVGHVEAANGGTLFLDEVTEMPPELQVKLLRVLESRSVTRVGATKPVKVDFRLVAASNRDPEEAVDEGVLREDLFYRLDVFRIEVPPLRDRGTDVLLIADEFLSELQAKDDAAPQRLTAEARDLLERYAWPGNVRELRACIEGASILTDGDIGPESLPPRLLHGSDRLAAKGPALKVRIGSTIAEVEKRLIYANLDRLDGDKPRVAETLGISLKTLYNRLNAYAAESSKRSDE